ncbi:MAG: hypothetical protein V7647_2391 [Acidobacteriota bacterium]|jgi:hypothetical protein
MPEQQPGTTTAGRRERLVAAWILVLLVLFRSAVLVFWEQAQFDSDQAITGLMAKHLSVLRAFPLFYYGQSYMLAVEAWLAAPVFLVGGVSVTTLKLPLLGINLAIGWLLLRTLEREAGLRPALALAATLPFVLPAPGTAARLLDANGGNVEPFLYAVLLWLTRARPGWGGLILGVGFLQREFTIYALLALLAIEAAQGTLFTRDGVRRRLTMLRAAAEVWLIVHWLKQYSSAAGPGTSLADIYHPKDNLLELVSRTCVNMTAAVAGVGRLFTNHWPVLFGTQVLPLSDFGIESQGRQGLPWSWVFPAAAIGIATVGITVRLVRERCWRREYDFCAYLTAVGLFSVAGYVAGRCGEVGFGTMRYDLLSILGVVGISAWWLRLQGPTSVRALWMASLVAWIAVSAVSHAGLLSEYLRRPPVGAKQLIVRALDAEGVHYATSDYWIAYAVTFMTNERLIVHSTDFLRIPLYRDVVAAHASEAVRVSRSRCEGARPIAPGLYLCRP